MTYELIHAVLGTMQAAATVFGAGLVLVAFAYAATRTIVEGL